MKAAGAALLLCAACTPDFRVVGDPTQPLDLDVSSGVPTTRMRGGVAIATAVIDTGSPVSALSNAAGCATETAMVLDSAAVPDRVRLAFPDLHPYCIDGDSVVGGDLLSHYEAIFAGDRCAGGGGALGCLQLVTQEVESTRALAGEGFAVLSFRLLGGGSFVDASGRTRTWPATRVPLRVCINPPAAYDDTQPPPFGVDATLLVATGHQPLTFTQSTIARIGLGMSIDRLVLVGQTLGGSVQDPGPCGELQRIRCLDLPHADPNFCDRLVLTDTDSIGNDANRGAYVKLDGPIAVAAIADEDPYIQGARNEVRPRISDIDGLLGSSILQRLEQVRIDYQGVSSDDIDSGTRVITRCLAGDVTCTAIARRPR